MRVERQNIKVVLSYEDMNILDKAKNILENITDTTEEAEDKDVSCIVTTEDNLELDKEEIWNAYCSLENLIMRM